MGINKVFSIEKLTHNLEIKMTQDKSRRLDT